MFDDPEVSETQTSPRSIVVANRNVLVLLVLAAFVTIHWRSSWLVNDPLWLDELHSVWVIDQEISDVFPRAAAGNQAPLYFVLAWLVNLVTPLPAQAIRGISSIAGGGLLVLVGFSVWLWTRRISAVLASIVVTALSGSQLFYATEGRPYELLCLVGCVHVLLFHRWIGALHRGETVKNAKANGRLGFWLAAVGVIAVLIHPLAILLMISEAVVGVMGWLVFRSVKLGAVIKPAVCWLLPPAVMFAIMLTGLRHSVVNRELWASVVSMDVTFTDMLRGLVVPTMVWVLWLVVDRSAIKRSDRGAINDHGNPAMLAGLYVAVTIGVCLATWVRIAPLALPRYCMVVAAVPFLLTGIAVGSIDAPWIRRLTAMVVAASMFFLPLPTQMAGNRNLATISGFGWNGTTVSIAGGPLRNEPWDEAFAWAKAPLLLFANIIEDNLLCLNPDSVNGESDIVNGISLKEYLAFPAVDTIPDDGHGPIRLVTPCSTHFRPRFSVAQIKNSRVLSGNGAYYRSWCLVVRGSEETAEDVFSEFLGIAKEAFGEQAKFRIDRKQFGDLYLMKVLIQ